MKKGKRVKRGIAVGGIMAAVFLSVFLYREYGDRNIVARVDGYPVTRTELLFYMKLEKNNVQNYYTNTYGITLSDHGWKEEVEGSTPEEYLKQIALEQCLQSKVLFIAAKQAEIIDYVDYKDFLTEMKKENEARSKAIAEGKIVYGLTKFTEEEYYSHVCAQIKTGLAKELVREKKDGFAVTEEEIKEYLKEHSQEWQANITEYYVEDIFVPAEVSGGEQKLAVIQKKLEEIMKTRKQDTEQLEQVLLTLPSGVQLESRTFTSETYQQDIRNCYEVRTVAETLQSGEISSILLSEDGYHLVWLREKKVNEKEAYVQYKERIRQTLELERLEGYLKELRENTKIEKTEEAI